MEALDRDASLLVPHRGRMCLVDRVRALSESDLSGQVTVQLRPDAPYFSEGRFQTQWLVEISAQAAAAISQLCSLGKADEAPPFGYLVSIREFMMEAEINLSCGDELRVDVRFEVEMNPVGQARCVIHCGSRKIAEGDMTFLSKAR